MPHLKDIILDGSLLASPVDVLAGSGVGVTDLTALLAKKVIGFNSKQLTVADTGGVNGGFVAFPLFTYPAKRILRVASLINFTSVAVDSNIGATATVKFALGTAAEATNDTLDSTQADIIASTNCVLVGSAGSVVAAQTATPVLVDATAGTVTPYLNIGVADAGITANAVVTLTGKVTFFYLEVD